MVYLSLIFLKLGEGYDQPFIHVFLTEEFNGSFIDSTSALYVVVFLLKSCIP